LKLIVKSQFVFLGVGPACIAASIYLCLSRLIVAKGAQHARFAPMIYTIFFIVCDVICLMLQGVGGGWIVLATCGSAIQKGMKMMLSGLAFQIVSLLTFMILWLDFQWRFKRPRNSETLPAASEVPMEIAAPNAGSGTSGERKNQSSSPSTIMRMLLFPEPQFKVFQIGKRQLSSPRNKSADKFKFCWLRRAASSFDQSIG
jgi:hypothetical protein